MVIGSDTMKQKIVFILIVFFLLCSFCGCISKQSNNTNSNNNTSKYRFSYETHVNPTTDDDFFILVPIPVTFNGEIIDDIIKNLTIVQGNGTFYIEKTIHGRSLNISGKEPITLESEGFVTFSPLYPLSLQNDTDGDGDIYERNGDVDFWIFSSNNYINISILYEGTVETGGAISEINATLKYGWQTIFGSVICGGA